VKPVSRGIDRVAVVFDEPNLVANAGLVLIATLARRLGLEKLCDATIDLSGRVGGEPGPQDPHPRARDGGRSQSHRPRRHAARRGELRCSNTG
jgi:hypothetical protein